MIPGSPWDEGGISKTANYYYMDLLQKYNRYKKEMALQKR